MATPSPKRRRVSRPSFMSPTKSSLARFNPEVLERQTQLSKELGKEGDINQSHENGLADDGLGDAPYNATPLPSNVASTPGLFVTPADNERHAPQQVDDSLNTPSRLPTGTKQGFGASKAQPELDSNNESDMEGVENSEVVPQRHPEAGRMASEDVSEPTQNPDPLRKKEIVGKRDQRDTLVEELKQLSRDVKRIEQHLDLDARVDDNGNIHNLVSVILDTEPAKVVKKGPQSLSFSSKLLSFLPFSQPSRISTAALEATEEAVPSHRPVELDDPMPYLRLFTPLTFDEEVRPIETSYKDKDHEFTQLHTITISSPRNLLAATVQMTTKPNDPSTDNSLTAPLHPVMALEINNLSPWAYSELLPSLRKYSERKDITALCTALSSYWDLGIKRADCWSRCEKAFPHLTRTAGKDQTLRDLDNRPTLKGKGGKRRMLFEDNHVVEETQVQEPEAMEDSESTPQELLLSNLGRDVLVLRCLDVLLRITWRIQFDWTGQGQSQVRCDATFPSAWQESDDLGSLKNLSATFDRLVEARGVFGAVQVIVTLVSG